MNTSIELVAVRDAATAAAARELITEYIAWLVPAAKWELGLTLDEKALLASDFGPGDRVWLARQGGEWAGVGGVKQAGDGVVEIQRMYVRPASRGHGAGRALLGRLLSDARAMGASLVRLESLSFLGEAHALYRSAGFIDVAPWSAGSMERIQGAAQAEVYKRHAAFMELPLEPQPAIDLAAKLAQFEGHWQPRTVAEFNGHDVMVVKVQGDFNWHSHADTDDFFLVLQGSISIDLPGGQAVTLNAGDLHVVPRGTEHRPRARGEAHLLLIEPTGTPNSGDAATAAPRRVL